MVGPEKRCAVERLLVLSVQKYPWEGHNEHYIYDAVGTKHKR